MTQEVFKDRVKCKLRGWYSKQEYLEMAVERICKLRDEFHVLLADACARARRK